MYLGEEGGSTRGRNEDRAHVHRLPAHVVLMKRVYVRDGHVRMQIFQPVFRFYDRKIKKSTTKTRSDEEFVRKTN